MSVVIIIILGYGNKLITAYPEYGTVFKCITDQPAGILYVCITFFMTVSVVYGFKIIYIKEYNGKGFVFTFYEITFKIAQIFVISGTVLNILRSSANTR